MTNTSFTTAVAYYRTSSATNVGADKDSEARQRAAVQAYAAAHSITIVHEFYDAAVKGSESVENRPGFAEMVAYMSSNGARHILIETANRFSRDLIVQETGYAYLKSLGFTLIAVDDDDAFTSDTPTAVLIRQILGAVAQFEKASLVAKLAGARMRKRNAGGHSDGRHPAPEAARSLAKQMRAEGMTLREIAETLAQRGFLAPSGKPYLAESVKRMLDR